VWWEAIASNDCFSVTRRAKYDENPTMLSRVTAKMSGVCFETQCVSPYNVQAS